MQTNSPNILDRLNTPKFWNWFYLLLILLVFFGLCSCNSQKQFNRLITKHPELIQNRDTLTTYDTVILTGYSKDTLFYPIVGKKDTFIIVNPRGETRVYLNETKSEARVTQEQQPDTLINTTQIISQYIDRTEARIKQLLKKYLVIAAAFVVGLFAFNLLIKNFKIVPKWNFYHNTKPPLF